MVETIDEAPYFGYERYQRECPNPVCEADILFHYASLGEPPVGSGLKLHVVTKCIDPECGRVEHYEPPVDEDTAHHLRTEWDGASYHPWNPRYEDPDEELATVFGEDVADDVMEQLEDLGYY